MSRFRVIIAGPAGRNLKRVPQPWRDRIETAIETIGEDPFRGRKVRSETDRWRIRVWPYRIVYRVDKTRKVVEVIQIGHRAAMHY